MTTVPSNYVVYRDQPTSGAFHAVRADGTEIATNSDDAAPVIQAALDQLEFGQSGNAHAPGDIFVQSGSYDLRLDTFTGFNVSSYTNLRLDETARLRVPNGYQGAVFQLSSDDGANLTGVAHATIDGGLIDEATGGIAGPLPQGQWTAFRLHASNTSNISGMQFNKIVNTAVFNAKIGVELIVDGVQGYINSNTFEFLRLWGNRNFVNFQLADLQYEHGSPLSYNLFSDLQCQCQGPGDSPIQTEVGINSVAGYHNTFFEVKVWDIQRAVAPGNGIAITDRADRTLIVGGLLPNMQNNSGTTKVFDS